MSEDRYRDLVLRRLDVIVMLLLESVTPGASLGERIRRLGALGVGQSEIGRIVGKPANYVGANLSRKPAKARRRVRGGTRGGT